MSKTIDEILSELYAFAYQDGFEKIRQDHPHHRLEAKQALLQWIATEVVGDLESANIHQQPHDKWLETTGRNQLRTGQHQILKDHGWKEAA